MRRPIRLAAVVATTAVLMTTAGFAVTAIQNAVAGTTSVSTVSADGPVLLGGASNPALLDATAVLGPIGQAPLPSIKKILGNPVGSTSLAPAPTSASAQSAQPRSTHEADDRPGRDD